MITEQDSPFDVAVVGAGIVGASIAYHLSNMPGLSPLRVLVLEAESSEGYHATSRSAALFAEGYGPLTVRQLTRASRPFFERPPAGFSTHALLSKRGALFVGSEAQRSRAAALHTQLAREGIGALWLEGDYVRQRVPVLRPETSAVGVLDAGACDIDVDALLQGFLRGARASSVVALRGSAVTKMTVIEGIWRLTLSRNREFAARCIVNAAGAWADEIASMAGVAPINIEPRRRSAFVFQPPEGIDTRHWPAVIAVDESWYFKPDAGLLLGSPANADLTHPHDVLPDEIDVATGIYRIEEATTLTIRRPKSSWAGLRSFVADGNPVCGFDPEQPAFFWAAALGGYGIQTSPAFGRLCAALVLGLPVPSDLQSAGIDCYALRPRR